MIETKFAIILSLQASASSHDRDICSKDIQRHIIISYELCVVIMAILLARVKKSLVLEIC